MSQTIFDDNQQAQVQPEKKSRGCLFGCLIAFGLMFGLAICAGVGGYWFLTGKVQQYTAEAPLELPTVQYEPEELAALKTKLESFEKAVDEGDQSAREIEISADDINALIANEETLKGKAFVKIEEGKLIGDVSFPVDKIPGGKGRYFNGSATLNASMESGVLVVTLADAEVNGEKLPQQFIDAMANENLAKEMYKNPENAKTMGRFEDIRIEDDKVILTLKPVEESADDTLDHTGEAEPDSQPAEETALEQQTDNA
jgi:hypothetical protein